MTTDITELAQSLKAAAEKATPGQWVAFTDTATRTFSVHTPDDARCENIIKWAGFDCQKNAKSNAKFIALANPANILALVEALEKAQRYIEELRDWNAGLAQESCERQQLISELEPIRAAAEKLVRCKGRYHSEQNYRALAALYGVNTPDLPPLEHENVHYADAAEMEIAALRQRIAELESQLKAAENNEIDARCHIAELESRTVTVKLPESFKLAKSSSGLRYYYADEVDAALTAAGIKVEAE
ncbi:ead/Ea22-like family protein [Klebsiella pneumoniae]|uniref:ead/Ea22-like family protein n=1 Tax=Klebsiella pneumoniae TaxID=573 RepID=UPI002380C7D1|nr:ead/Ea22-like family protein [Klebsiella pneumoniae]MDE4610592.1 ead/Ea22-like family protein [Klebsiella pneumoniae]